MEPENLMDYINVNARERRWAPRRRNQKTKRQDYPLVPRFRLGKR